MSLLRQRENIIKKKKAIKNNDINLSLSQQQQAVLVKHPRNCNTLEKKLEEDKNVKQMLIR